MKSDPIDNPYAAPSSVSEASVIIQIHSLGGIGLAGLFGGPLAAGYLTYRNLQTLGLSGQAPAAVAWFALLMAVWLYFIFSVPPDLLSQLIPFFPQAFLWWLTTRHILGKAHTVYRAEGGFFRSKWAAVRIGLFIFLALKIIFFAGGVVSNIWFH